MRSLLRAVFLLGGEEFLLSGAIRSLSRAVLLLGGEELLLGGAIRSLLGGIRWLGDRSRLFLVRNGSSEVRGVDWGVKMLAWELGMIASATALCGWGRLKKQEKGVTGGRHGFIFKGKAIDLPANAMKASEVLRRYADGERDFRRTNLQGQSFKGAHLSGADFSEADIRGANFAGAILHGANFTKAKAGLGLYFGLYLTGASYCITFLFSFCAAYVSYFAMTTLSSPLEIDIVGGLSVCFLLIFGIFARPKGFIEGFASASVIAIFLGIVVITMAGETARVGVVAIVGASAITVLGAFSVMIASAVGVASAINRVAIAVHSITIISVFSPVIGAIAAGVVADSKALTGATAAVVLATAVDLFISIYLGWRAIRGDNRDAWIRNLAVTLAATGGTNFYRAQLMDANFTGAILKNTNLLDASLVRTCFKDTKKLSLARVGETILNRSAVRDLLVSGDGYKKSYEGMNLEGANLAGANLEQANFKGVNLANATLSGANLKDANLAQTQCIGTNFTHAYLSGACLEAWNIDYTTQLENVDCQFVFLLESPNTRGSRERRPHDSDKVFVPGDFEKLYKQIVDTVQILLRNGMNAEAFQQAFQELMAKNPEITPHSIQSIERKGEDVLVTLEVPPETYKDKIEHQFKASYVARLKAQLEAEESHNKELTKIINTLASANKVSINIDNRNESKAMTGSTDNSRKIENRDGNVIGNVLGDNSTISGTVAQTINQIPATQDELKTKLSQLQALIQGDGNLQGEDEQDALECVQNLAEASQNPNEADKNRVGKAIRTLKRIAHGLPTDTQFVLEGDKLLEAISQLFH